MTERMQPHLYRRRIAAKHITVFLDLMAGGGYYRQLGYSHGVAKSTVIKYCQQVA